MCPLIFKLTLREVPGSTNPVSGSYGDRQECVGEIPGQQFFDSADRMFGDMDQDLAEIGFRVEIVQFSRRDQRIDGGSAFAA